MSPITSTLISKIISHEGSIPYAYEDSLGYLTIGVGRLIDKRKGGHLSDSEISYLLNNDLIDCYKELSSYSWFNSQDIVRQGALIELSFNMGLPHLLCFKNMIEALLQNNYLVAAQELLLSEWAKEVSTERVADLHSRLLNGSYS